MTTVAELLAQYGIKLASTTPGRYYATCPQCSASRSKRTAKVLGVTISLDGSVCWGCNHCGWTGPEKGSGKPNGNAAADDFAASYDYPDATGVVRFQKVRNLPGRKPRFWLRRPDGNGGWINGTEGVDTTLIYRLPEINEAIAVGYTILVPEGEKDCDNLWSIGIPATCNAHGAADATKPNYTPKWRPEHSAQLRRADIVILNDNDVSGRAHADAAARMSAGIAARVRILDLAKHWPEVAATKGGDVSDGLAAGRTREELDALIAAAPEFAPAGELADLGEWNAGDDEELWGHIPPREWLLGNIFCRGFLSSLLADGGTGKTALRIAQMISLAAGRSLTGEQVFQRCRVLIISLEDSARELRRRIRAACIHHGVWRADLNGQLFIVTLKARDGKLMVLDNARRPIRGPLIEKLEKTITARRIDLVSLDPFVKAHRVEENLNTAIDEVTELLTNLCEAYNLSVDTPHHTSKGSPEPGNANRGRGASAMKDAARLVYTLTPMTSDEAEALGVSEAERRSLIRMDSGKVNIAPPMTEAKWFRLVGVPLGNSTKTYPSGDNVQTVEPWSPPDIWSDLSIETINIILSEIEAGMPNGQRYSAAPSAKARAAWKLITVRCPAKSESQARQIIKTWLKSGLLVEKQCYDENLRRHELGLEIDGSKRPGNQV